MCTFLCLKYDIYIDIHPSFFIATVIFPLAFILNASYLRRERALEDIAMFKASAVEVYFCIREWTPDADVDKDFSYFTLYEIRELFRRLKLYLGESRREEREPFLQGIYLGFSKLSKLINIIRRNSGKIQGMWALNTRLVHYHRYGLFVLPHGKQLRMTNACFVCSLMCLSFEKVRVIREYQTPRSLRAFTKVLIYFLPIFAVPYFVFVGVKVC